MEVEVVAAKATTEATLEDPDRVRVKIAGTLDKHDICT